jgi:ligand-binding sensor domain-containing protein
MGGISDIKFDGLGRAWVATSHGLFILEGDEWTSYTIKNSELLSVDIPFVDIDPDNRVWIRTHHGLILIDGEEWTAFDEFDGFASYCDNTMAFTDQGSVWLGTCEGGLWHFEDNKWTAIIPDDWHGMAIVVGYHTWAVEIDHEGRVWAGIANEIKVIEKTGIRTINSKNSGLGHNPSAIVIDQMNRAWIATNAGLSVVNWDDFKGFNPPQLLVDIMFFLRKPGLWLIPLAIIFWLPVIFFSKQRHLTIAMALGASENAIMYLDNLMNIDMVSPYNPAIIGTFCGLIGGLIGSVFGKKAGIAGAIIGNFIGMGAMILFIASVS